MIFNKINIMTEPINHHFVPQFYLKSWVTGQDNKLWEVRNFNGNITRDRRAPKSTGYVEHLYSYTENFHPENRAEIETKFFRLLDDAGAKIVNKFLLSQQLSKKERIRWAQFISGMRVRTPENINKIKEHSTNWFSKKLDTDNSDYLALKQDKDPADFKDWVELNRPGLIKNIGVGQIPKIVSNPKVLADILAMDWFDLDVSSASRPLLTSDCPCVFTTGLQHKDCVIALPLTPKHAFFAFYNGSKAYHSLMRAHPSEIVKALNYNVVTQANERVYCQQEYDAPDNFFQKNLKLSDL